MVPHKEVEDPFRLRFRGGVAKAKDDERKRAGVDMET